MEQEISASQWRVRCTCGHRFTVSRGSADASIMCPACQRELTVPPNAGSTDRKSCPFCLELIHPQARKCPFCQEYLSERPPQASARRRTSGMAIASLVLALAAPVVFFITGLPAAALGVGGILATRQGKLEGRGMAIAGLLLGIVWTLLLVGVVALLVLAASLGGAVQVAPPSAEPLF